MKKKYLILCVFVCFLLGIQLSGCSQTQYAVNFDLNYKGAESMEAVQASSRLAEPEAPIREGYTLLGWFKDAELTEQWDFGKDKVTSAITLYAGWDMDTGDTMEEPGNDKDFSALRTPGRQESAYEYGTFFLPEMDGTAQPYVGDTMPY